ncbi:MAG: DNA replication and repair protein RecF [Chlamydiae bacterium]|nr:DNA replication and repair protein RecF [Chlamydiota bacterium]
MYLQSLHLRNFRIYTDRHFTFSPRVNVICGPNACGKTSILEAISLLMTGRSFRTSQTKDVIRHGASFFYVEAIFVKHGVEQSLKMSFDGKERKILHNHTLCPSLSGLLGLLQGAVMIPDDVALIKGAPGTRRRFLDQQLAQVDPLYVHHLTRYHRAMRQRNQLLRMKNLSTIETWEHEMAKAAAYIVRQRYRAVENLKTKCQEVQAALSGAREDLSLVYKSNAPAEEQEIYAYYLKQYAKTRPRELQFGSSLVGPHKDDLQIFIGNNEARYFASEGQQRSCVAALRFAEWGHLNQLAEDSPLMLIDDVGVSLDKNRRKQLFSLVGNLQQVYLTTTEELNGEGARGHNFIRI